MVIGQKILSDLHLAWSVSAKILTKYTPYLDQDGKAWNVFCEFMFWSVCYIFRDLVISNILIIDHVMRRFSHIYYINTAWHFSIQNKLQRISPCIFVFKWALIWTCKFVIWNGYWPELFQLSYRGCRNPLEYTVYPKKYAHGFCFAVLCCGCTLTDFPISIRFTSLALWQSNDCPSASKATQMNMDKYCKWIHYERLHTHNKAKHNKTVCIFLGIYCSWWLRV